MPFDRSEYFNKPMLPLFAGVILRRFSVLIGNVNPRAVRKQKFCGFHIALFNRVH